jgi:uncharacterized protein (TIGR02217 family)
MSFYEVRFPINISYGSSGGPGFSTTIIGLDAGAEQRVARWSKSRRRFNVAYGVKTYTDLQTLIEFYMSVKGAAYGFRYKDWTDFTTAADGRSAYAFDDVALGTNSTGGTVASGGFTAQMAKRYSATGADGSTTTVVIRNVTKPVFEEVKIGKKLSGGGTVTEISSSNWTINTATGVVTINEDVLDGTTIYGGCEFDVPVRFTKEMDTQMNLTLDTFDTGSMESVDLVEILDHGEHLDEYFYGGSTTKTLNGNGTLAFTEGRAIVIDNDTLGSIDLTLPDPSTAVAGGPYFFIFNASSAPGNTIVLKDDGSHGGSSSALNHTLAKDKGVTMWLSQFGDNSRQWRAWAEA